MPPKYNPEYSIPTSLIKAACRVTPSDQVKVFSLVEAWHLKAIGGSLLPVDAPTLPQQQPARGRSRAQDVFSFKDKDGKDWGYLVRWGTLASLTSEDINALPSNERAVHIDLISKRKGYIKDAIKAGKLEKHAETVARKHPEVLRFAPPASQSTSSSPSTSVVGAGPVGSSGSSSQYPPPSAAAFNAGIGSSSNSRQHALPSAAALEDSNGSSSRSSTQYPSSSVANLNGLIGSTSSGSASSIRRRNSPCVLAAALDGDGSETSFFFPPRPALNEESGSSSSRTAIPPPPPPPALPAPLEKSDDVSPGKSTRQGKKRRVEEPFMLDPALKHLGG